MREISKADLDMRERGLLAPGRYLCRAALVTAKQSTNGDDMWNVKYVLDKDPNRLACYDIIMLGGKGAGIGVKKLLLLGAARDAGDSYKICEPTEAEGMVVWLNLIHEERNGKSRCVPDFKSPGFGYEAVPGGQDETDPFAAES